MHEFEFIRSLMAPLAAKATGALGLADDAALVNTPEGSEMAVTTDALVQGVHFIGNESPDLIARKLLRVNLSDLAAMGAAPHGYFLALMLPAAVDEAWLRRFADGLAGDGDEFGITLMGGDTTRNPGGFTLAATALGMVPRGAALTRAGARPGDDIYVSGTIGDGALGLKAAKGKLEGSLQHRNFLLKRYQLPQPRLILGQKLRGVASACMDISDGLMQDLGHICERSRVGAVIEYQSVPLSEAARAVLPFAGDSYATVLAGGDDYELLFTAEPIAREAMMALAAELVLPITRIGHIEEGRTARALDAHGNEIELERKGYTHF